MMMVMMVVVVRMAAVAVAAAERECLMVDGCAQGLAKLMNEVSRGGTGNRRAGSLANHQIFNRNHQRDDGFDDGTLLLEAVVAVA